MSDSKGTYYSSFKSMQCIYVMYEAVKVACTKLLGWEFIIKSGFNKRCWGQTGWTFQTVLQIRAVLQSRAVYPTQWIFIVQHRSVFSKQKILLKFMQFERYKLKTAWGFYLHIEPRNLEAVFKRIASSARIARPIFQCDHVTPIQSVWRLPTTLPALWRKK